MIDPYTGPPLEVRGGKRMTGRPLRRLLVRGTNWIGDAVMTLPALTSLRAGFPDAHVAVLAKPWVADVYRLCPAVDEIVVLERPGRLDGARGSFFCRGAAGQALRRRCSPPERHRSGHPCPPGLHSRSGRFRK